MPTRRQSFGVNWAEFTKGNGSIPAGAFISPVGGTSIVDLASSVLASARARQVPAPAPRPRHTPSLPTGTTLAVGRIAAGGLNFAAMMRAMRGDTDSNVIATPSTVTLDNQEAEIKVADEVPFITGSFTNTGTASNGSVNPFQTVQREEVGTILKVTPQIAAEGNAVVLKICDRELERAAHLRRHRWTSRPPSAPSPPTCSSRTAASWCSAA